jgi:curved DNA-binding protein
VAAGLDYKDYYAVLGVPKTASQADIKKAFRKLARQHHPDAKPGDSAAERKFKEVNEANEVLSDPPRKYDELGPLGVGQSRGRRRQPVRLAEPARGRQCPIRVPTTGDQGDFSDFFRMFFGQECGAEVASRQPPGHGARAAAGLRGHPAGMGTTAAPSAIPARPAPAARHGRHRR